jgi:uncharacterized protein involved in exopolysaccharide biosynthesis
MSEELLIPDSNLPNFPATSRPKVSALQQTLEIGFRHRQLSAAALSIALLAALVAAFVLPSYESSMKVLVKHERVDPVVTADNVTQMPITQVTEQEMNSEVELLTSNDVLRKAAIDAGLVGTPSNWFEKLMSFGVSPEEREQAAVRRLAKRLDVEMVKRSNVIDVTYRSRDHELAARVMKSLAAAYLDKHLAVNRMPTGMQFFEKEVQSSQQRLAQAEAGLTHFGQIDGVSPDQARQLVVQKLNDFKVELQQTSTGMDEASQRLHELGRLLGATPERRTTAERRSDNAQLEEKMKGTLLDLELKRTGLLDKFEPTYPLVQEVEKQIAQTKAAIAAMQQSPVQEKVTDADPTHDWVRNEMAKVQADYSSLKARQKGLSGTIASYENLARDLDRKAISMAALQREAKVQEANYLLYTKKQEEARISDALDRQRVVNISLAEEPTSPVLPVHSSLFYALVVGGFFVVVGAGFVYTADRIDPSVRNALELENSIELPVLADVPRHRQLLA